MDVNHATQPSVSDDFQYYMYTGEGWARYKP